jgi:hypothetical protein
MLGMTNGTFTNTSATPITGLLWLAVVVTFGIRRPGGALLGGLALRHQPADGAAAEAQLGDGQSGASQGSILHESLQCR